MIFKATMQNGKRQASLWLIGRAYSGQLTRHQEFNAWATLARLTRSDSFACASFYERRHNGSLEIVCAGNTF